MKKPSTLAQQIQQAQREVSSWSPEMRASVRLQGHSALMSRYVDPRQAAPQPQKTVIRKK